MNQKDVRDIIDKLTNAEHAYYVLNEPITVSYTHLTLPTNDQV